MRVAFILVAAIGALTAAACNALAPKAATAALHAAAAAQADDGGGHRS
jgi:lipopolysaccharide export LptBFGC system permease protein LptF